MECVKFISLLQIKIYNGNRNLDNHDLTNYTLVITEFYPVALNLMSTFRIGNSIGHNILVWTVED